MEQFQLQPPEERLQDLAEEYVNDGMTSERDAFDAGERIRQNLSADILGDLVRIVEWKSPRNVHHIRKNEPKSIKEAIDEAIGSEASVERAILALTRLDGVGIPIASAILTTIFPERYTVIDFRALESLGYDPGGIKFYEQYLTYCQSLAKSLAESGKIRIQYGQPGETELRVLDRALWQWSKEQSRE